MDKSLDLQYDRLLGEGAYGKVFLVRQQDGQQFAVKEIDLSKCDDAGREQANREAALLSRLNQDNILRYIESVVEEDSLYIITEYCAGGDMEEYLEQVAKQKAVIPESLASQWIVELAAALKYLHDEKILHRDMKTKNIFLKEDLTVKLGDLGIAKVLDLNQSKADTFIGTPSYMSPELFTGKSYNHKTDIWGLGCCVYEMLTLKRAFQGKALWTLIREIKNGKVLELPDTYSLDLRALVQDMMNQDPDKRPSANEIVADDLLLYHKRPAKSDIEHLPKPKEPGEKKQSRNSSSMSGGSFNRMLKQKGKDEEEKFRNSIAKVCEKINTLNATGKSNVEDFNTFVYHGDSDDEGELEASGTILDSTLLKQYTEQLDTFVYKGDSDGGSDSDYSTGGSVMGKPVEVGVSAGKVGVSVGEGGVSAGKGGVSAGEGGISADTEEDTDRTLVRQYSSTLGAALEEDSEDTEEHDDVPDSGLDQTTELVETFNFKYKYRGLKDTFMLKPDRKWKNARNVFDGNDDVTRRHSSDSALERRRPLSERGPASQSNGQSGSGASDNRLSDSLTSSLNKPRTKRFNDKLSLSASFSGSSSFHESKQKSSEPRLMKTVCFEGESLTKTSKMKVCDRIAQSTKSKEKSEQKTKSSKPSAFIEIDSEVKEEYQDHPDRHVRDMMSHLKDHLAPFPPHETEGQMSETLRSDGSAESQDPPSNKGKKKKVGLLKKQSEAKKKTDSEPAKAEDNDDNVRLFTRAQFAKFKKDDDDDDVIESEISGLTNGRQMVEDLRQIKTTIYSEGNEEETNKHIVTIQRELAEGIGYQSLQQVLNIMSMVQNEQEMKLHLTTMLGPKLFEDYKEHLSVLRLLEVKDLTAHTSPRATPSSPTATPS